MKEIENLDYRPFTRFCMSIAAVPSSYLAGMTIDEQLLWLCSYLEKEVIPAVNNNGEAVTELQGLYEELHDYVEHYFDNLDVQEEINNKLDDMVDDGTLQAIIAQYISTNMIRTFETVNDMIEANLEVDMVAKTEGYYTPNDGGGATYKIVTTTTNYAETLENNLKAELLIENDEVNALQIGIKRNDNTYDSHNKILNFVTNYNYCLFFPKGNYYLSETFFNKNCHVNLKGETTCYINNTYFIPYGNNNGYIIKCGGKANFTTDSTSDYTINQLTNIIIDGITFSDYDNPLVSTKYPYFACLVIDNCSSIKLNAKFYYCQANGLLIRESWELKSDWISCRAMFGSFNTCGILFANRVITSSGSNISCLMFDLLDFEAINGKCIITESNSNCGNIAINKISIENGRFANPDLLSVKNADITTDELNTYRTAYHFNPLLQFNGKGMTIAQISTDNVSNCNYYADGNTGAGLYTDALLEVTGDLGIGEISMPGVMTAILTNPATGILDTVTISSFKSLVANTQSIVGRKVAEFVYIIPKTETANGATTFVDILDKTIVINPDYVHTVGNGFYSNLDLCQLFTPHRGWQCYANVDNKCCFKIYNNANVGGILNKIKIPSGKTLTIRVKALDTIYSDMLPLLLLDDQGNTLETINSGESGWTSGNWYEVSYSISSTAYYQLKLDVKRNCAIEWVDIS